MTTPGQSRSTDSQLNERVLTSLALIQVNWDSGRVSHLDNFVPFAVESMVRSGNVRFTAAQCRECILTEFGIEFPLGVVSALLRRCREASWGATAAGGDFELSEAAKDSFGYFKEKEERLARQQSSLAQSLLAFGEERFQLGWELVDAEAALLDYVAANGSGLLDSALRGRKRSEGLDRDASAERVVVASWIDEQLASAPEKFDYLIDLVKGSMLATSLFVDGGLESTRRFAQTSLYLDTAVVLRALGLEGPERRDAALDALRLAKSQGADLRVLEATVREARGVVTSAAQHAGRALSENARAVDVHAQHVGWTRSDLEIRSERLELDLERLDVLVRPSPVPDPALTVDETALEDLLTSTVAYGHGARALRHDLDALTAIHRRRRGAAGDRLENSRAVFITANASLAQVARRFPDFRDGSWPRAMLLDDLTTILWAKQPLAAPELPRHRVAAACASVLAPDPQLWHKYLDEVDRLRSRGEITDEDVALLRYRQESQRALVIETLGQPSSVDSDTVHTVLENVQAVIRAPIEGQLELVRDEAAQSLGEVERSLGEAQGDLAQAVQEKEAAEAERDGYRLLVRRQVERAVSASARVGRWVRWGATLAIALVLVASLFLDDARIIKVSAVLLLVASVVGNLTDLGRAAGSWVSRARFRRRVSRLGLAEDDVDDALASLGLCEQVGEWKKRKGSKR